MPLQKNVIVYPHEALVGLGASMLSQEDADQLLALANSWAAAGELRLKSAAAGLSELTVQEAGAINSVYQSLAQSLARKVGELRGLSTPKKRKRDVRSS